MPNNVGRIWSARASPKRCRRGRTVYAVDIVRKFGRVKLNQLSGGGKRSLNLFRSDGKFVSEAVNERFPKRVMPGHEGAAIPPTDPRDGLLQSGETIEFSGVAKRVNVMLSGNDFSMGPEVSSIGGDNMGIGPTGMGVKIVHIPIDATWPLAPEHGVLGQRDSVADSLHRKWRESRVRLQLAIDIVETPVLLLHTTGEIAATNRAWRMGAKAADIRDAKSTVGMNYLNAFRAGAAEGNRDAAISAEGIEGVLEGRSRSFYYKYRWCTPTEQRLYAMLAWQIEEEGTSYIAVSHELLEAHAVR